MREMKDDDLSDEELVGLLEAKEKNTIRPPIDSLDWEMQDGLLEFGQQGVDKEGTTRTWKRLNYPDSVPTEIAIEKDDEHTLVSENYSIARQSQFQIPFASYVFEGRKRREPICPSSGQRCASPAVTNLSLS